MITLRLECPGKIDVKRRLNWRHDVLDFLRHLTGPRAVLAFTGAKHLNFGDYDFLAALAKSGVTTRAGVRRLIGTIDPAEALAAERAYLASFFNRFLEGHDDGLLERRPGPYPDVVSTPLP